MIEQGELLILSNNKEYAVVSSIIYNDVNYVYLLDTEEYKDYKFCEFVNDKLKVVKDPELLKVLITQFNSNLKENIVNIVTGEEDK